MDIVRLKEKLGKIPDPRRPWGNLRHKLEEILDSGTAGGRVGNEGGAGTRA